MVRPGLMIDGSNTERKILQKINIIYLLSWSTSSLLTWERRLRIISDVSRQEIINEIKYFTKWNTKFFENASNSAQCWYLCTFLRVFAREFYRSSHAKFSTEVCLFRSFISDPGSSWTNRSALHLSKSRFYFIFPATPANGVRKYQNWNSRPEQRPIKWFSFYD